MRMSRWFAITACTLTGFVALPYGTAVAAPPAGPLYVGWAQADITPPRPVPLVGQMHKRISQSVHDPLRATALALEIRGENGSREQAILICCDLCVIRRVTQERVREAVRTKLADFDADKLLLNSTHTHTAPPTDDSFGATTDVTPEDKAMTAREYADLFVERVSDAAARAWQGRKPGGMSWALGQAVVGHNRRAVSADGKAVMYGDTAAANFDHIEGYEDHGLPLLFFFDGEQQITGILINVACPSQETENESYVSADFWHEVREGIRAKYGKDICVLAQCGAAGDQSPHFLLRKRAEDAMLQREGLSRREEIARRIARAVDEALPGAKKDIQTRLVFRHTVARLDLPGAELPGVPFYQPDGPRGIELHAIRLGEVAIATNPFELFLDYGVRIQAQSKALLTAVVQLSGQHCGYLPTAKAVRGGGYSADKYVVGPEGGEVLVRESVKLINGLWE